jgi:hypothetical protein
MLAGAATYTNDHGPRVVLVLTTADHDATDQLDRTRVVVVFDWTSDHHFAVARADCGADCYSDAIARWVRPDDFGWRFCRDHQERRSTEPTVAQAPSAGARGGAGAPDAPGVRARRPQAARSRDGGHGSRVWQA